MILIHCSYIHRNLQNLCRRLTALRPTFWLQNGAYALPVTHPVLGAISTGQTRSCSLCFRLMLFTVRLVTSQNQSVSKDGVAGGSVHSNSITG